MTYIKYSFRTLLTLLWVRPALIDFKSNMVEVPRIPESYQFEFLKFSTYDSDNQIPVLDLFFHW